MYPPPSPKNIFSKRILAFDYGQTRTGVAVTDEMGLLALPLGKILTKNRVSFWQKVESLLLGYQPIKVLLGLPLHLDLQESAQTKQTRLFANAFQEKWPQFDLELIDERLSSRHAEALLKESGCNRKKRSERSDETSAWILLSCYLEKNSLP